jgi:hypothetical protein
MYRHAAEDGTDMVGALYLGVRGIIRISTPAPTKSKPAFGKSRTLDSESSLSPVRQFLYFSENRSKSARVRAICDYAWTRRTSFTALLAGIKRKLSARDFRSTKIRSNFAFTEVDDAGALSVQRSGVSRFWPACLGDVPLLGLARLASRRWLTRWSPRLRLMPTPSAYKSACRQIS